MARLEVGNKVFFTLPEGQRVGSLKELGFESTEWQKLVVGLKEKMTISPKSLSPVPDFSGKLTSGDLNFGWRCWEAGMQKFFNIAGELKDTKWNLATFCLELPEDASPEGKEDIYQRAEKLYLKNYEAIRCALFEKCQEEKEKYQKT